MSEQTATPVARPLSATRRAFFVFVLVGLVLLVGELGSYLLFHFRYPRLEVVREVLTGQREPAYQRSVSQPYLLYAPMPNYSSTGEPDHNEQGYRGRAVPMRRRPGVLRVLCMGGSTTYGWSVDRAAEAYPARLEELLRSQALPGEDVEVINAGLPYGTSAEILTHYLFKYHYYKPDVVILNTGGNDADAMVESYYQPDYSHWRQAAFIMRPLPRATRWLAHSRLVTLGLAVLVYGSDVDPGSSILRTDGEPPAAHWYPEIGPERWDERHIPREELAFYHNVDTVMTAIEGDGARLLLVPFRPAPAWAHPAAVRANYATHEQVLEELADAHESGFARFPAAAIDRANWTDNCHLNARGEREKARYLLPFVATALWPERAVPEPATAKESGRNPTG